MNTYGTIFKVSIFGESHGHGIGVTIDGCPPGLEIDEKDVQLELDKRRPGQTIVSTERKEKDQVKILSGILNGKTTGAPITMRILNVDVDSSMYELLRNKPRPGHADFTAHMKYHGYNDYRGGGIFSGRMTTTLVMAGAIAKKALSNIGIQIIGHTIQIGNVKVEKDLTFDEIASNREDTVKCADPEIAKKMIKEILNAKEESDSVGGIVECIANNVPIGLGEPFFDTAEGEIGKMMFSIPAVKGIEFGIGFHYVGMKGSIVNDQFTIIDGKVRTKTNNAGGILGGITNGMPIVFRVVIKPTSSIGKKQTTVNMETMKEEEIIIKGRHDPCIVPRAVPVIEAGTAIVLLDLVLRNGLKVVR